MNQSPDASGIAIPEADGGSTSAFPNADASEKKRPKGAVAKEVPLISENVGASFIPGGTGCLYSFRQTV